MPVLKPVSRPTFSRQDYNPLKHPLEANLVNHWQLKVQDNSLVENHVYFRNISIENVRKRLLHVWSLTKVNLPLKHKTICTCIKQDISREAETLIDKLLWSQYTHCLPSFFTKVVTYWYNKDSRSRMQKQNTSSSVSHEAQALTRSLIWNSLISFISRTAHWRYDTFFEIDSSPVLSAVIAPQLPKPQIFFAWGITQGWKGQALMILI